MLENDSDDADDIFEKVFDDAKDKLEETNMIFFHKKYVRISARQKTRF